MNIRELRRNIKSSQVVSALAIAGVAAAVFSFNKPPPFPNTDNFVLFASEEIKLEKDVQVSSGDLGSNKKLDIEKGAIINGNLLAQVYPDPSDIPLAERLISWYMGKFCPQSIPVSFLINTAFAQAGDTDLSNLEANFPSLVRAYDKIRIFEAFPESP